MDKIKSYCEEVTGVVIEWKKGLTNVVNEGLVNEQVYKVLLLWGASWITDPVGCLELKIPRYTENLNSQDGEQIVDPETGGVPIDEGLVDMSIMFYGHLERREFEDCLHVLKMIEDYAKKAYSN